MIQAGFSGDGGPAIDALLNSPTGVGVDAAGSIYIVDTGNQRIRKVNRQGVIATVAGNGQRGPLGDGGPAIDASLNLTSRWYPRLSSGNVAVDAAGNLYIADTGNGRIRKVTPDGMITSVAFPTDPWSVAVDKSGNLYFAETAPHAAGFVHKMTPEGVFTTVAGFRNDPEPGPFGPFGDGGLAVNAWLLFSTGVAVDAAGNVYIADSVAQRIYKVNTDGKIGTVAGSGDLVVHPPELISGEGGYYDVSGGYSGDGGWSTNAQLNAPSGIAVDAFGSVYIADSNNHRIRKVSVAITVSAASYSSSALASKAIATVFGDSLATATQAATVIPLPTSLAGTQVSI
jgi:sugar lactone lactonase YvrE